MLEATLFFQAGLALRANPGCSRVSAYKSFWQEFV